MKVSNWDAEFAELVALYLAEAGPRLAAASELAHGLRAGAPGSQVQPLLERFHAFAGSGRSHGLPEVSELGLLGERLCLGLQEADTLGPDDVAELRRLVELLRGAFERAARPD
jgi:hypothetical protein